MTRDEAMKWAIGSRMRDAKANEALDKMADNARELGLDYEPVGERALTLPGDGVKPWQRRSMSKSVEALQQDIEKEATRNIKRLGVILDFDSETLQTASKVRLEEAIKAMARIRDANRALKEKTDRGNHELA